MKRLPTTASIGFLLLLGALVGCGPSQAEIERAELMRQVEKEIQLLNRSYDAIQTSLINLAANPPAAGFIHEDANIEEVADHMGTMHLEYEKNNRGTFLPVMWQYAHREIDPSELQYARKVRYAGELLGYFILATDGPDGDTDLRIEDFIFNERQYTRKNSKGVESEDIHNQLVAPSKNQVYDPTNGLISNGDLFVYMTWDIDNEMSEFMDKWLYPNYTESFFDPEFYTKYKREFFDSEPSFPDYWLGKE